MGVIREARETDLGEVFNLIQTSFSNRAESDLVKQLISDNDVLIILVFDSTDSILGNVIVSKVTLEPNIGLFCGGIAPLSVLPDHQSTGIGTHLLNLFDIYRGLSETDLVRHITSRILGDCKPTEKI